MSVKTQDNTNRFTKNKRIIIKQKTTKDTQYNQRHIKYQQYS